jgi:hypothetical protein
MRRSRLSCTRVGADERVSLRTPFTFTVDFRVVRWVTASAYHSPPPAYAAALFVRVGPRAPPSRGPAPIVHTRGIHAAQTMTASAVHQVHSRAHPVPDILHLSHTAAAGARWSPTFQFQPFDEGRRHRVSTCMLSISAH